MHVPTLDTTSEIDHPYLASSAFPMNSPFESEMMSHSKG